MNEKDAREIIQQYELHSPKPSKYYYDDPYKDGYQNSSGWRYEYPPVDSKFIDAILERDKYCKPYDPEKDSTEIKDEKFCDELAKRFTDLMTRSHENERVAVEEYRKNNSHLLSMVTEYNGEKITVIPMKMVTKSEFEEECEKVSAHLGLVNYFIYNHKDEGDDGHKIFECSQIFNRRGLTCREENALRIILSFCEHFKKYSYIDGSEYRESVFSVCDEVKTALCKLKSLSTTDYIQRIKNYVHLCNQQ